MLTTLSKSLRLRLTKVILLGVLAGLVCLGAMPGYLSGGKWRWESPPSVKAIADLRNLKKTGLALPGWQTVALKTPLIGEHKWVQQDLIHNQTKATLLLFPQNGPIDQPQVEWTDLNGFLGWKTDSQRSTNFSTSDATITTQFFRAWTQNQTYAVLQWYAWSEGGHPAPSRWFVVDRLAQWQNRRATWVAVSIILPIEPMDDLEKYWSNIESIAQTVQSTLTVEVLRRDA